MSDIGSRIKLAREAAALSQEALARAAGISLSTVSKYEQRQHGPSGTTAAALARVLGVSTDWLLTGVGRGPHSPTIAPDESAQEVSG